MMLLLPLLFAQPPTLADRLAASNMDIPDLSSPPIQVEGSFSTAPALLWSIPLPGDVPSTATRAEPCPPTLHGNYLYIGYTGASGLLILDANQGALVGMLSANAPVASAPIFLDGKVFFSDTAGYVWSYPEPQAGFAGSPQATWSRYVAAPVLSSLQSARLEEKTLLYATNVDDQVYALDAGTGELVWRYGHLLDVARASKLSLFAAPSVLVRDTDFPEVVAGFSDGMILGLNLGDGEVRWTLPVGEGAWPDMVASATVASGKPGESIGDTLLVGSFSGPFLAMDANDHSVRWQVDLPTSSAPLVTEDIIWHGGADGILRKINRLTGEVSEVWKADIPGISFNLTMPGTAASLPNGQPSPAERNTSGTLGTPLLLDAGLLVSNSDGALYLIDPTSGKEIWNFEPGFLVTGVLAVPVVAGDRMYVVSNAGFLYVLGAIPEETPEEPAYAGGMTPWVSPLR